MIAYRTPASFRAALEARLQLAAREGGRSVGRSRKFVAFDRLLARLQRHAEGRWMLKGGFALELRLANAARATRDVDLDWNVSVDDVTEAMIAAAALDLGDHFEFRIERTGEVRVGGGRGFRFRADAFIAGRLFEQLAIDVGFVDRLQIAPDLVDVPNLLAFAGIPTTRVPVAALERHLAEKLHAYTRRYGAGSASSRPKDLIDMLLISEMSLFEGHVLRAAMVDLFTERATHDLPGRVPPPPSEWARAYGVLAAEVDADPDPRLGHARVARLLDPILGGEPEVQRWDPARLSWSPSDADENTAGR